MISLSRIIRHSHRAAAASVARVTSCRVPGPALRDLGGGSLVTRATARIQFVAPPQSVASVAFTARHFSSSSNNEDPPPPEDSLYVSSSVQYFLAGFYLFNLYSTTNSRMHPPISNAHKFRHNNKT